MTFAEKLDHMMKSRRISQSEVVSETGTSYETVDSWLSGKSLPDTYEILKLSRLFRVIPDYFLRENMTRVVTTGEPQDFYDKISNFMIWLAIIPNLRWICFDFTIFFVMYGWVADIKEYGILNFGQILRDHAGIRMMFFPMVVAFVTAVMLFIIKNRMFRYSGEKQTFFHKLEKLCRRENTTVEEFAAGNNITINENLLPCPEDIVMMSDYFDVSADYLLRDEVTVIHRPEAENRVKGLMFIALSLRAVVSGMYMMANVSEAVTAWYNYYGRFAASQIEYDIYFAPAYRKYLPAAAVYAALTAACCTAAGFVKKSDRK